MPTISRFLGIAVSLYYNDHPPAHFHAEYQGHKVKVAIETGEVTEPFPDRREARPVALGRGQT